MKPILAHKGKFDLDGPVRGLTGHSSEPSKGDECHARRRRGDRLDAQECRRFAAGWAFEDGFDPPYNAVISAP